MTGKALITGTTGLSHLATTPSKTRTHRERNWLSRRADIVTARNEPPRGVTVSNAIPLTGTNGQDGSYLVEYFLAIAARPAQNPRDVHAHEPRVTLGADPGHTPVWAISCARPAAITRTKTLGSENDSPTHCQYRPATNRWKRASHRCFHARQGELG